ncbi:MAG TPA: NAD-dependent epimerase/dehydratase family protein [Burkholderiales bacterium]|nr:NAD-dependent epimerase/dehydratase family protein [Burkholderiales bacterium]
MESLLIIGCGDIARRALPLLRQRYRLCALVRSPDSALASSGVEQIEGDLDIPESLERLAGRAHRVVHLAPPARVGSRDSRTRNLVAALSSAAKSGAMLPRRFVYLSTSGVYGDCAGEPVDETRAPRPVTERARRRLDAELAVSEWGAREGVEIVILRAPGIYARDRLPLAHITRGTPALYREDDVYTNHIHADDLAAIVAAALHAAGASGTYNASDDSAIKMGDWLDLVADHAGLPRPRRVSRAEASRVVPADLLSFMSESRRLSNDRLKGELGVRLSYPTVVEWLASNEIAA